MNRKIALIDYHHFITDERLEKIRRTADGVFELIYYPGPKETDERIADCEILFGMVSRQNIRDAKNARWVCAGRVGVNTICDPSLYASPDIVLTNSPGVYAVSIAEYLVMCSLMLLRRQYVYAAPMKEGKWGPEPAKIQSLKGSRITVMGTGSIGTAFASRLRPFEPEEIIGVRNNPGKLNPAFDRIAGIGQLEEILPETDILALCLPDTPKTKGILSAERIAMLPDRAFVLNIGRGSAIDQEALTKALQEGRLAGAALDVMTPEPLPADHPLRQMDNVILTPHTAGIPNLDYSVNLIISRFCEDLERYIAGEPVQHVVDISKGY